MARLQRLEDTEIAIEEYRNIKSWDQMKPPCWEKNLDRARAAGEVRELDHGYDTLKSIYSLTDGAGMSMPDFAGKNPDNRRPTAV